MTVKHTQYISRNKLMVAVQPRGKQRLEAEREEGCRWSRQVMRISELTAMDLFFVLNKTKR